ncbi:hypothetical protein RCL1_000123 [Eukaryota sp. TZLM3-RCL]
MTALEDTKKALFLKGHASSELANSVLSELHLLKKPHAISFNKKNNIFPFEEAASLEFLLQKNECSLFAFANSIKKRPHNIILGRSFNYKILDMVELGIQEFTSISSFSHQCALGSQPFFNFLGDQWSLNPTYQKISNLLLDFFRGKPCTSINLSAFDRVITCHAENDVITLLHYGVLLKKSGIENTPLVELVEIGPRITFTLRRTQFASGDLLRNSLKQPKDTTKSDDKNKHSDDIGNTRGQIHMERQDFEKLDLTAGRALRKYTRQEGQEEEVGEQGEVSDEGTELEFESEQGSEDEGDMEH